MELGEKIRRARLDAGLSQRQLCGEEITRNMLSLIENGSAKPSMKTLSFLAGQLGRPISYFLDEKAGENEEIAESARALIQAEKAAAAGKDIYASQLLEKITWDKLQREKLLLEAKLPGADLQGICEGLPSLDEELLLRAEAALGAGDWVRCRRLLEAAEDQHCAAWNFIMGRLYMAEGSWKAAEVCLAQTEHDCPEAIALLEVCFREQGDFKRAYEYACRQRG